MNVDKSLLSKLTFIILFFISLNFNVFSQDLIQKGEFHGSFQTDIQYCETDSAIEAYAPKEKLLMNSFTNIVYTNQNFSAGLRFESYINPIKGFDERYKGSGIPYRYASFTQDYYEITAGNFYEQFGSGLIYRSYEDKNLGIDNSIDGIKVKIKPREGVVIKGIYGHQRYFWSKSESILRGGDAEFNINQAFKFTNEKLPQIIIGGGMVSKYQEDKEPTYNLPENVSAYAARINITKGIVNFFAEYAGKINDPSTSNNYIFKEGQALFATLSLSKKGVGGSLSVKRIDNMDFRMDRNAIGQELPINYLPATTKQHTYSLLAFYPYASQPNGEMALQTEVFYTFPKNTLLGGAYGTQLTANYSVVNSISKKAADTSVIGLSGTLGYKSDFFTPGREKYFEDLNFEVIKKINKDLKLSAILAYVVYNQAVIEGHSGEPLIYGNIGVLDISYKLSKKNTLRTEFQHLQTSSEQKAWASALVEFTFAPSFSISVSDVYNYGNKDSEKRFHYYNTSVAYVKNASRIALTYGKQRAGIVCVGGVCRLVPAFYGATLSITTSF